MSSSADLILPFVTRMIVPLQREFGRRLDVHRFVADPAYAERVLELARGSRDQRMRNYAEYIARHLGGAREALAPKVREPAPGFEPTAPGVTQLDDEAAEAQAQRLRILKRYQGGVR